SLDERLRFRGARGPVWVLVKAVVGLAVAAVLYVLRFVLLVLLEPQINPLKHFPTVTVGHKLLLPLVPTLAINLEHSFGLDLALAGTLAFLIIASIPGLFGFIVWETTSNWRLYRANRSPVLHSIRIGSHGEHVPNLLRPGLHSGTLPILFAR